VGGDNDEGEGVRFERGPDRNSTKTMGGRAVPPVGGKKLRGKLT